MDTRLKEVVSRYRQNILQANKELTKKEHFKDMLNRLYAGHIEIETLIDTISAGAERTILDIPRAGKLGRGAADTLYNKVIIEFENDLRKTGNHAKQQLAGYLLGQFATGEGYNYTLIASDFITWRVYAPSVDQLAHLQDLREDQLILDENKDATFVLTENNEQDFYFWLDRYLFRSEKQRATLKRVEQAFGYQSATFIACFRQMSTSFNEAKKYGQVQVAFEQWRKFLSIAYGKFDAGDETFLIHTYLSVFSKMLAYSVVSGDDYIDEDTTKGVLDGSAFTSYQIKHFVENDFFWWVSTDQNFGKLQKVFRLIAQEIAGFDFTDVDEDVLKGVYQELIDLDTRHALGEYYTPDWLCERVVEAFDFGPEDRILDPSCGSGSFLRAAVHRLKALTPSITVDQINAAVYGIDIHPLSVQIAKTTMLIALGPDVRELKQPIRINVVMANTLLAPEGASTLFGEDFTVQIDRQQKQINTAILQDATLYDDTLDLAEALAEQTMGKAKIDLKAFSNILSKTVGKPIALAVAAGFYEIYLSLKKVKEDGRDTIWKFILSNTYKPYFMQGKFDYVIGNPPWFTYASIKNEAYQKQLLSLATRYDVKPSRAKNMPHLEIAAIFMAHCASYFLKPKDNPEADLQGRLAFVLPRSFYTADQHDNIRSGLAKGFKLTASWDLMEVTPLFRIPSCVLFADKVQDIQTGQSNRAWPATGLPGLELAGRLPAHNCNWQEASAKITETSVKFFIGTLGNSTAFSTLQSDAVQLNNPYKALFKQGATIVPRTFYFVEVDGIVPDDFQDRTLTVKTANSIKADAKKPWKDIQFRSLIESHYLFYTALSNSILPYCIFNPALVTLPILISEDGSGSRSIAMRSPNQIMHEGHVYASKWFQDCENVWSIYRTEKNTNINAYDYLNWHHKLQDQNINTRYVVIYNASAKNANAGVLDRTRWNLPFVLESKAYGYFTNNEFEAYYLIAFLNSDFANKAIKNFQTKGLFGARDVHKKILDVFFPRFDAQDPAHLAVANASRSLGAEVLAHVSALDLNGFAGGLALGKLRLEVKAHFKNQIECIETLCQSVLLGGSNT